MATLPALLFVLITLNVMHINGQSISTADLLQKIEALEKRGQVLERRIAEQAMKHQEQIQSLQTTITKQATKITVLEGEISTLKVDVNKINEVGYNIDQDTGHRNTDEGAMVNSDKGRKSKRLIVDSDGPVAFQAEITRPSVSHIAVGQKMVYDSVFFNLRGGYNNNTGVFTTPQAGIYIFSTSVMSFYKPHNEIWVRIMKNGQAIGSAFAYGDNSRDQGSITVVTDLAVGDQVWVALGGLADDSLWGDGFTSFMGSLVIYF